MYVRILFVSFKPKLGLLLFTYVKFRYVRFQYVLKERSLAK